MNSTTNLVIRAANRGDVDGIWNLMKELLAYHKFPVDPIEKEDILKNGFEDPIFYRCYLAEVDDKLVGFALTCPGYSMRGRVLNLECLYVQDGYRNLNIGLKLMQEVAKEVIELNCQRLRFVVIGWNRAKNFYSKIGAENATESLDFQGYFMERDKLEALLNNDTK